MLKHINCIILFSMILTGCGQKGELYLPGDKPLAEKIRIPTKDNISSPMVTTPDEQRKIKNKPNKL